MSDFIFAVVPRPGIGRWRGGENLISPKKPPGQETPGPADQQQSQAAGPLLMYPLTPSVELKECEWMSVRVWVFNSKRWFISTIQNCRLDLFLQTLSRPACLCYGATLSTTCCIALLLTPRIPWCPALLCSDHASQTVWNDSPFPFKTRAVDPAYEAEHYVELFGFSLLQAHSVDCRQVEDVASAFPVLASKTWTR